jgi:isoleucyl-tRNA synthetase
MIGFLAGKLSQLRISLKAGMINQDSRGLYYVRTEETTITQPEAEVCDVSSRALTIDCPSPFGGVVAVFI